MSEPNAKEALERLGSKFEPPPDGLDRARRRRNERRRHRRVSAALVALSVAAGGGTLAWRAFSGTAAAPVRHPRPVASGTTSPAPIPSDTSSPPNCPSNQGEFSWINGPGEGTPPPGAKVTIGGPVPLLDQSDQQVRPDTVWVWWNLDPATFRSGLPGSSPVPGTPGESMLLGQIDVQGRCSWTVDFRVPDVEPGTYPVVAVFGTSAAGGTDSAVYRLIPLDVGS